MMKAINISPIIKIPWDQEYGIPEVFAGAPLTSIGVAELPEKTRALVKIRVIPSGKILLLTLDNTLLITSLNGDIINKIKILPVSSNEQWSIIDFIIYEDYIYLLESFVNDKKETYNLIRKINQNGVLEWTITEKVNRLKYNYQSINTTYQDFLLDQDQLYICSGQDNAFSIFMIDNENRKLKLFHKIDQSIERVFNDSRGNFYYVKETENKVRKRDWVKYNPKTKQEEFQSENKEMFELLGIPVAADDSGNGYGIMGYEMGCIDGNNFIVWKQIFENIVPDPHEQQIYISKWNFVREDSVNILVKSIKRDSYFDINIPDSLIQKFHIKNWRLINVDEEGNFLILGVNPRYFDPQKNDYVYQKILLTIDAKNKEVININNNPSQLFQKEFRLQGANSWKIDGKGNIYLPVLGPEIFYVFKMEFVNV